MGDHRVRLEAGVVPVVPAPVVAQASRSPSQVQLRRLLRGCDVVPMTEPDAHDVGGLLARSGTSDVIDAVVALLATQKHADTVSSEGAEIRHLLRSAGGTGPGCRSLTTPSGTHGAQPQTPILWRQIKGVSQVGPGRSRTKHRPRYPRRLAVKSDRDESHSAHPQGIA